MNDQEKDKKQKGYSIELINDRKILFMKDKSLKEIFVMSPNGFIVGDVSLEMYLTTIS